MLQVGLQESGWSTSERQAACHRDQALSCAESHVLKVSMWAQPYCQMINISGCAATPVARKLPP